MVPLYAIARRFRGRQLEFYVPVSRGDAVGWTDDLAAAWCWLDEEWALKIQEVLVRHGFVETFVYAFHETFTEEEI